MAEINVGVINASTSLLEKDKKEEVEAAVAALQKQVERDFAPVWGRTARITLVPNDYEQNCPDLKGRTEWWWLVLLETSNEARVLGYHDFTNSPHRMPLGKVFVTTTQDYGRKWTVTASHELLEMLVDPALNLSASRQTSETTTTSQFSQTTTTELLYAYDICDPCQAEIYQIDGVDVSNFVYPAWFETFHPTGTQFDHCKKITEAFQLQPGGYINVFDTPIGTGWRQLFKEAGDSGQQVYTPPLGSRRERRIRRMSGALGSSDPGPKVPKLPESPPPPPPPIR